MGKILELYLWGIKMLELLKNAKKAAGELANLSTKEKDKILDLWGKALWTNREEIIQANKKDLEYGEEIGLNPGLMDRLRLDEERIQGMIQGLNVVRALKDPIGSVDKMIETEDGLRIGKMHVPIGVIGIIYEARPNVTVDCTALTFKSGNALILRGGKEAIHSNKKLVEILQKTLTQEDLNKNFVQFIDDPTRESSKKLMEAVGYVDLLIPRGSASLIHACIDQAKVPVLQTGEGNCHVYIDASADLEMAWNIVENAKTQRIGVCNAVESILVHKNLAKKFLQGFQKIQEKHGIKVHGDQGACEVLSAERAEEEDWGKEYLAMECSIKIVESLDEAITHINQYSTGHSEVIVTESYKNSQEFLKRVDSACVYVNASSRFTDGGQFGMGAEMGISTQKIHARGPVGLEELTSYKYIIYGNGQVRK